MTEEMLLKNMRSLNRMMQRAGILKPIYEELCAMCAEMLDTSALLADREGKIMCVYQNREHTGSSFKVL